MPGFFGETKKNVVSVDPPKGSSQNPRGPVDWLEKPQWTPRLASKLFDWPVFSQMSRQILSPDTAPQTPVSGAPALTSRDKRFTWADVGSFIPKRAPLN